MEKHLIFVKHFYPIDWGPGRLLHPWDSPGKNTGVGCHSLLQGNLPDPGIEPGSPALQAEPLPSELPGKTLLPGGEAEHLTHLVIKVSPKGKEKKTHTERISKSCSNNKLP